MDNLLETLREFGALRDNDLGRDVVRQRSLPAIEPAYANEWTSDSLVPETLREALRSCGIERLYQHQADALEHALAGSNVVLQAPTASGKTLAFQIPMLQSLTKRGSHALMIYPNKALALDQREQLNQLTEHMRGSRIKSWWYDGDVDPEQREVLREHPPSVLITNPDMLHMSFLGHSDLWSQFLSGLKWVIVDEIHEYRGYFGSNVAMILRRFSHHLASCGVNPQFFLSSATCANAREHAENLTGRSFVEVNAVSMRPSRQFTFVQPSIPDFQYWDILQLRAVNAGFACLSRGKSVLVFCPTRKFTEACHRVAIRRIKELGEEREWRINTDVIRVFRGGLSRKERHDIQAGLKSGAVRLVFTTNALEIGIDIGGLDGIIMAGFPDNMMSAWQRIGRAGRSWESNAFVLYYSRNNPLDRFYAENLDGFLGKPLDDLVVSPDNEDLIEKHLPSLLYETPWQMIGDKFLGPAMSQAALRKIRDGAQPVVTSGRWRPHGALNIRGGGSGVFVLKEGSKEIGTLSEQQQFREAYERAIYMHGGRNYRVAEISSTGRGGEITLSSVDPGLRTNAILATFITEQEIYDGKRWVTDGSAISTFYGKALITEFLNAVEEVDERTGDVVDRWKPNFNSAKFDNAHAFWIVEEVASDLAMEGIGAFQHLLRIGALFSIPLDAHDIYAHAVLGEQKAYLVESYPGGIGIVKKVLERWRSVLEIGIRVAEGCRCRKGCPNCIVPPRSRIDVDKTAGIRLARQVIERTSGRADFQFRGGLWEPGD